LALRPLGSTVAVASLLLAPVLPARAHSLLLESSPAANAVLAEPPAMVALRFNNRIEKRLSRLQLIDNRGQVRPLAVRPDGPPDRVEAPLPPLGPGPWRLEWHVLSTDGHVVSGIFPFRISH
jgi:methionine-rich copper-binding protein CopC